MLIYFLFSLLFLNTYQANDKLIFVVTSFRHGARQQNERNKNDPYGENWDLPMELTGVGKRMHYILGLRNRVKYIEQKNFLSEKYDVKELEVYTSFKNRTIMSVLSHLQGLYPQSEKLGDVLNEIQLKNSSSSIYRL